MKKPVSKRVYVYIGAGILSVLCFVFLILLIRGDKSREFSNTPLTSGWTVQRGDTVLFSDADISDIRLSGIQYGDVITLQTTLPTELSQRNPELFLKCYHSAMEVWVGDLLCYEYAMDRLSEKKFAGSGYHTIALPEDLYGKELRICFYPIEDNVLTTFQTPLIYSANNALKALCAKQGGSWIVGIFLLLSGVLIQFIVCLLTLRVGTVFRIYFVGLFAFLIGLWSTCYFNFWQIFDISVYQMSTIENLTLFWATIPIMLYFYRDVVYTHQNTVLSIYRGLLFSETAFIVLSCILHFTNIIHFKKLLGILHVFQVLTVLFIFYCIVKNFRRRHRADQIQMIGISLACMGVLMDVAIYDIILLLSGNPSSDLLFTAIGTLFFVLGLIIAFVMETMISFTKKTENEILKKYAYTDGLTSIGNRHACEEKLRQVNSIADVNYGIISIDLNNLKKTNDSYGHDAGDTLLKAFAGLLKDYFEKYGFIGRMGGDEFLIVIDNAREFTYEKHLAEFQQLLTEYNQTSTDIQLAASFGYAAASEWKSCTAHEVYCAADNRMYESKRLFKTENTSNNIVKK